MEIDDVITITLMCLAEIMEDHGIMNGLLVVARDNYENPRAILEQEITNNRWVYLAQQCGQVVGFFMVGWHPLDSHGGSSPDIYLGLSSVRRSHQGRGLGTMLYRAFAQEVLESSHHQDAYFWFYTASPIAARAWWKLVPTVCPSPLGLYTDEALAFLECLAERRGWISSRDDRFPFVLRGIALARYMSAERLKFSAPELTGLFTQCQLDESAGDRFVFVGKLSQLTSALMRAGGPLITHH